METMHAGEYVELLVEQGLETLLALVTGVYLYASVLYHPEFLFQGLCIGRVAVHQHFEP